MRWLSTLMIGLIATLMLASEVLAQAATEAAIQKPNAPPQTTPLLSYFAALLLAILVGFAAMKSSKRTHQD